MPNRCAAQISEKRSLLSPGQEWEPQATIHKANWKIPQTTSWLIAGLGLQPFFNPVHRAIGAYKLLLALCHVLPGDLVAPHLKDLMVFIYFSIFFSWFPSQFLFFGCCSTWVFVSSSNRFFTQDWRGGVRRTAVDALARLFTGSSGPRGTIWHPLN